MNGLVHIAIGVTIVAFCLGGCSPAQAPAEESIQADNERVTIDGSAFSNEVHQHFASGNERVPFELIERDLGEAISPAIELEPLARDLHRAVNATRRNHGLSAYKWDASLAEVAASHSADMAANSYFGHEDAVGNTVNYRALQHGEQCQFAIDERSTAIGFGENLAKQSQFTRVRATFTDSERSQVRSLSLRWLAAEDIVDSTVAGWMNSPGHRYNVLHEHHQAHGIAIARSDDHVLYITQVLC